MIDRISTSYRKFMFNCPIQIKSSLQNPNKQLFVEVICIVKVVYLMLIMWELFLLLQCLIIQFYYYILFTEDEACCSTFYGYKGCCLCIKNQL